MKTYSLLNLGDSYTIGEGVPLHDSFPYQTIQLLRKANYQFTAPEVIAKTGWTSFELLTHLNHIKLCNKYDFVTLLVGVNNQYRELSTEDFSEEFEVLINKSIALVGGDSKKVIVLSIPDWGVTPFASDRDADKIADEINAFNGICELIAQKQQTQYINITDETRKAKSDITLLTNDRLHYSSKEHQIWASKVFETIIKML